MLNLSNKGNLSDFLPWFMLITRKIVLNIDGSLMGFLTYTGVDTGSISENDLDVICYLLNNILRMYGTGYSFFFEVQRVKQDIEFERSTYPCKACELIEKERIATFRKLSFYENRFYITIQYKPEPITTTKFKSIFLSSKKRENDYNFFEKHLKRFKNEIDKIVEYFKTIFPDTKPLQGNNLVKYLSSTISKNKHPIGCPEQPILLNDLADQTLVGGLEPMLGEHHIRFISCKGWSSESYPLILNKLLQADFPLRYVIRYICIGKEDALSEIQKFSSSLRANSHSLSHLIKSVFLPNDAIDEQTDSYCEHRADECEAAKELVNSDIMSIGYLTLTVMVWDKDISLVNEKVRTVGKIINEKGCISVNESFSAVGCFLGSIPGNLVANVRRSRLTSLNVSHLIPISSDWQGQKENPYLNGPSLFVARSGNSVFNHSTHVSDVGHGMIVGPIGGGKSYLMKFSAQSFLKYPDANAIYIDKDYSALGLTRFLGGTHFDLGKDDIDQIEFSNFTTIELGNLANDRKKDVSSILTSLFAKIESILTGSPTLILIDEFAYFFKNQMIAEKIEEWLRLLRKMNASVLLASQTLSDIAENPIFPVIVESCPTQYLLPNPKLNNTEIRRLYSSFGLTENQLKIIQNAIPKKEYYIHSDLGSRLIDLAIENDSITHAICGSGSKEDIKMINHFYDKTQNPDELLEMFLKYKGVK